jgi:hypothetical protein
LLQTGMSLRKSNPRPAWRIRRINPWAMLAAATLFAGAGSPPRAAAQSAESTEYAVKAAFLFNFTKFVEWPENAFSDIHAPIILGIVGDDPFDGDLVQIVNGQSVRGRMLVIHRYRFGDDLRHCQVLFVSASEQSHVANILASVQGTSVLTVSDVDKFADDGGMMQFVVEESRVRFVVNLDAATQAKLQISAKLLALAHVMNHAEGRGVN